MLSVHDAFLHSYNPGTLAENVWRNTMGQMYHKWPVQPEAGKIYRNTRWGIDILTLHNNIFCTNYPSYKPRPQFSCQFVFVSFFLCLFVCLSGCLIWVWSFYVLHWNCVKKLTETFPKLKVKWDYTHWTHCIVWVLLFKNDTYNSCLF